MKRQKEKKCVNDNYKTVAKLVNPIPSILISIPINSKVGQKIEPKNIKAYMVSTVGFEKDTKNTHVEWRENLCPTIREEIVKGGLLTQELVCKNSYQFVKAKAFLSTRGLQMNIDNDEARSTTHGDERDLFYWDNENKAVSKICVQITERKIYTYINLEGIQLSEMTIPEPSSITKVLGNLCRDTFIAQRKIFELFQKREVYPNCSVKLTESTSTMNVDVTVQQPTMNAELPMESSTMNVDVTALEPTTNAKQPMEISSSPPRSTSYASRGMLRGRGVKKFFNGRQAHLAGMEIQPEQGPRPIQQDQEEEEKPIDLTNEENESIIFHYNFVLVLRDDTPESFDEIEKRFKEAKDEIVDYDNKHADYHKMNLTRLLSPSIFNYIVSSIRERLASSAISFPNIAKVDDSKQDSKKIEKSGKMGKKDFRSFMIKKKWNKLVDGKTECPLCINYDDGTANLGDTSKSRYNHWRDWHSKTVCEVLKCVRARSVDKDRHNIHSCDLREDAKLVELMRQDIINQGALNISIETQDDREN